MTKSQQKSQEGQQHKQHSAADAAGQFFQDMSAMAGNAFGTMLGARGDMEQAFKARMEQFFTGMNLVTREEFEAVKAMAAQALKENAALKQQLEKLEKNAPKQAVKAAAKKSSVKKAASKKPATTLQKTKAKTIKASS